MGIHGDPIFTFSHLADHNSKQKHIYKKTLQENTPCLPSSTRPRKPSAATRSTTPTPQPPTRPLITTRTSPPTPPTTPQATCTPPPTQPLPPLATPTTSLAAPSTPWGPTPSRPTILAATTPTRTSLSTPNPPATITPSAASPCPQRPPRLVRSTTMRSSTSSTLASRSTNTLPPPVLASRATTGPLIPRMQLMCLLACGRSTLASLPLSMTTPKTLPTRG